MKAPRLATLVLLVAALGVVGCRSTPRIGKPWDWPVANRHAARGCLEDARVVDYLLRLKERVLANWHFPDDARTDQYVAIGFVLDAQGQPERVAVFEASDPNLVDSALQAFDEATPIPIPAGAGCIAGVPFDATFRNPASAAATKE